MDHDLIEGHTSYIINVKGRTKYMVNQRVLGDIGLIDYQGGRAVGEECDFKQQMVEYCVVKRYSELLTFHKILHSEMKNYMKKKGM